MDLDLRLVRYFTVVAEHLNFGRAAAALHVAQPSLSRHVMRLEAQLGVTLMDRTPSGSTLTEAGRAFLPEAKALLAAADRARRVARNASGAITVGYAGGLMVTPAVRALRRRFPDAEIRTRHLSGRDTTALTDRKVNAVLTHLPFPAGGARVTHLYDEPRVLVLPRDHPLAVRGSASVRDLSGAEIIACPAADLPSFPLPPDAVFEDKAELVAEGRALAIAPLSDRRLLLRPDLTRIPLTGMPACRVIAATRASDPSPLAAAFHEATREMLCGPAVR